MLPMNRKGRSDSRSDRRREIVFVVSALLSYNSLHSGENILAVDLTQLFSVSEGDRKLLSVYQAEGLTVDMADMIHIDQNAAIAGQKAFVLLQRCRYLLKPSAHRYHSFRRMDPCHTVLMVYV